MAFITGLKNSCKGLGYFVGAASLYVSFEFALGVALALIAAALPVAYFGLAATVGRTARGKDVTLRTLLLPAPNIRRLSLARAFLFASRDLWRVRVCQSQPSFGRHTPPPSAPHALSNYF